MPARAASGLDTMDRLAFHEKKAERFNSQKAERRFVLKRRREGRCPHHVGFTIPCMRCRERAREYYGTHREQIKKNVADHRAALVAAGLCRDCKSPCAPFKRCLRHRRGTRK